MSACWRKQEKSFGGSGERARVCVCCNCRHKRSKNEFRYTARKRGDNENNSPLLLWRSGDSVCPLAVSEEKENRIKSVRYGGGF